MNQTLIGLLLKGEYTRAKIEFNDRGPVVVDRKFSEDPENPDIIVAEVDNVPNPFPVSEADKTARGTIKMYFPKSSIIGVSTFTKSVIEKPSPLQITK